MVGAEAAKALLQRAAHEGAVPSLRALALGVLLTARVEHVSELGGQLDLVAVRAEHPTHELLVCALAVGVAGLEERDPELERLVQQALAVGLADVAPPGRAKGPRAEADLRRLEVGVTEAARPHAGGV